MASRLGKLYVTDFVHFTDGGRQVAHLPERTSPGESETLASDTIRAFAPLVALTPAAVVHSLYLES
jgi:hypothetical protein